jgi:hypothetical protein
VPLAIKNTSGDIKGAACHKHHLRWFKPWYDKQRIEEDLIEKSEITI